MAKRQVSASAQRGPRSSPSHRTNTEVQSEAATGLSQEMGSFFSDPDNADLVSQEDDELNPIPQTTTPDTSVSKGVGQGATKRAKKTRITEESTSKRIERRRISGGRRLSKTTFVIQLSSLNSLLRVLEKWQSFTSVLFASWSFAT